MYLFELVGNENHPAYKQLQVENLDRQYSFVRSIVNASLAVQQPLLSIEVVKALNYHAISCLHVSAGEFRTCHVQAGDLHPPMPHQVPALMQMFTNFVNRLWDTTDAVFLAALVLWRLNAIHPFVNGNGRTARVASYFVLCLKSGGWLAGDKILPERIVEVHGEYVEALKVAHASALAGQVDLKPLHALLVRLLDDQMKDAEQNGDQGLIIPPAATNLSTGAPPATP